MSVITAQQALEIITGVEACPDPPVTRGLAEAAGHVLAREVTSPRDIPPFNRSAMDGYAVRSRDVQETPARLEVVAVREAGDQDEITFGSGECVKIMTGAAVPDDADAVVMIETTRSDEPARYTEILKPVNPGENIARRGEDAQAGSVVLHKYQLLTAPALSLAAGVGHAQLKVYPQPELAVLQTGGELMEPGEEATGNKIYNSNAALLAGMIHDTQIATSRYLGICPDQKERLTKAVKDGLQSKVLILTGGVSKGDFDYVPEVLISCGVRLRIQGVRIKPGKPLTFGSTETGGFVFGLPGNPVSVMVCFHEFVVPLLKRLAGLGGTVTAGDLDATLSAPVLKKTGRAFYCSAKLFSRDGQLYAEPIPGHGSGDYVSAAEANGVIIIPGDITRLETGTKVKVHLWQVPPAR